MIHQSTAPLRHLIGGMPLVDDVLLVGSDVDPWCWHGVGPALHGATAEDGPLAAQQAIAGATGHGDVIKVEGAAEETHQGDIGKCTDRQ